MDILDPNYCHPHNELAEIRKQAEHKICKYIVDSEHVFEIAASERTIDWNYRNMFYNRPVIDGFNNDIHKLAKLRRRG